MFNATPRPLYPQERPGTHCIEGWVGHMGWSGRVRKISPHRDSIPGPSSRRESLCRLSYPGPNINNSSNNNNNNNNRWRRTPIMKLFITIFSSVSHHFLPLRSTYYYFVVQLPKKSHNQTQQSAQLHLSFPQYLKFTSRSNT